MSTSALSARESVNLPNVLTAGRLAVVPAFALLLLLGNSTLASWAAAGLFALACLTDVLDGYLARSRGQVTNFGIMADPIADKALIGSALVGLSLTGALPWWATGVILAREVGVTVMRGVLARHGMMPANRGGKLKSLAQNLALMAYLVPLSAVAGARLPLLVCAVLATVYTGAVYARQGIAMRRRAHAAAAAQPQA